MLFIIVSNHPRSKVFTSAAVTPARTKRIQVDPVSVLESAIRDDAVIKTRHADRCADLVDRVHLRASPFSAMLVAVRAFTRCHHVNKIVIITIGDMCSLLLASLLIGQGTILKWDLNPRTRIFTPAPWLRWSPKQNQGSLQSCCTGKGRLCPHWWSLAETFFRCYTKLSYSLIAVGAFIKFKTPFWSLHAGDLTQR